MKGRLARVTTFILPGSGHSYALTGIPVPDYLSPGQLQAHLHQPPHTAFHLTSALFNAIISYSAFRRLLQRFHYK